MSSTASPHTPSSNPTNRRTSAGKFEGMGAVEVKVTVRPDQELRAERAMMVNEDTADVRMIYFFDTPDLELFKAGIALRARLIKGDPDNSTVKFRPVDQARVSDQWRQMEGFKLEADWVGDRVVCSASLTCPEDHDQIVEVADGKRAIEKLFSKDQERFLKTFCNRTIDFEALRVMGPIRVLRWKLEHKRFAHELCVEEWRLPNGEDLVEISIKVPPGGAHQARRAFDAHLADMGLDPGGAQETKTSTALQYFAQIYKQAH